MNTEEKAAKAYQKKWRNVIVPVSGEAFAVIGLEPAKVRADCLHLLKKHPEHFSLPEDIQTHLEYVLTYPLDILPATKEEYTLVVRGDKAVVINTQIKQGNYRVISAYTMKVGQLEVKKRKWEESQLEGRPSSVPASIR